MSRRDRVVEIDGVDFHRTACNAVLGYDPVMGENPFMGDTETMEEECDFSESVHYHLGKVSVVSVSYYEGPSEVCVYDYMRLVACYSFSNKMFYDERDEIDYWTLIDPVARKIINEAIDFARRYNNLSKGNDVDDVIEKTELWAEKDGVFDAEIRDSSVQRRYLRSTWSGKKSRIDFSVRTRMPNDKAYDIADFYAYPDEDDKKEAKLYEAARREAINFANWFEDFILKLEEENNQEED